ncbi:MAG: hypothetical protein MUF54_12590 [Polyangiaceae bacterium]|jgi:hypothetical protein|nr:hypothetical protein [Polyangiaceae bacterium]
MRSDGVMDWRTVQRRLLLQATVATACGVLPGCRPGLGAQLRSSDYVHTFVQRDLEAVLRCPRGWPEPGRRTRALAGAPGPGAMLGARQATSGTTYRAVCVSKGRTRPVWERG